MVKLNLFVAPVDDEEPRIFSFEQYARSQRGRRVTRDRLDAAHEPSQRGRLLHLHGHCPECHRVTVEPVELQDGWVNRNGATIPGTATIVGFHCHACGHEWSV